MSASELGCASVTTKNTSGWPMGPPGHIRLTSHPAGGKAHLFPITWGAPEARARGPVIGSITAGAHRNVIGAHGGAYSIYRALAVSSGARDPVARPDLKDTHPVVDIGPHPQWSGKTRIVSIDPWGHRVAEDFRTEIEGGLDIRPTIAVTRARGARPGRRGARARGRIREDGAIVRAGGEASVTKAAVDPVWYLPGVAGRGGGGGGGRRRARGGRAGGGEPGGGTRR